MKTNIYPVFGLLEGGPGTTLVHATTDYLATFCGRDCREWYGDTELTLEDIECTTCKGKAISNEQ